MLRAALVALVAVMLNAPLAAAEEAVVEPSSSIPTEIPSEPPITEFPDVPADDPAIAAIRWAQSRGIASGYEDGLFRPTKAVSRVEVLKLIYLAAATTPTDASGSDFPDLAEGAWYLPYVATAEREGVVHGYMNGTFGPDRTVTRVEFLKMAFRVHGANHYGASAKGLFSDTPSGRWFVPYVNLAVAHDLVDTAGSTFGPDTPMAREDVVTLLFRMVSAMEAGTMQKLPAPVVSPEGVRTLLVTGEGVVSYYHDSLAGNGTASGQKYDPTARTCAHPSLPFNTLVTFANVKNEKQGTCTVNDRGPYVTGRILDLSRASFEDIATLSAGVATVRWSATITL